MILLRREPAGAHLPGAVWDRAITAKDMTPMRAYHEWTLRQLTGIGLKEPVRYELRPVPPEALR